MSPYPPLRGAALALACLTSGCVQWSAMVVPDPDTTVSMAEVRVTRTDGSRVRLTQAWVRSDSLGGTLGDRPVAIEVSEVRRLEYREANLAGVLCGLPPLLLLGGLIYSLAGGHIRD